MSKNSNSGGIGFFGLLTLVFIVLRLCKVITWSWFWVLSPTIIPIAIALFGLAVYLISLFIAKRRLMKRK